MRKLLGQFHYSAPDWLKSVISYVLSTKLGLKLSSFFNSRHTNKKLFYNRISIGILGLAVILSATYFGINWWQNRPRPEEATFNFVIPGMTDLETGEADSLKIKFSKSVAKLEDLNLPVTDRITMRPEISGVWSWASDSELAFKPDFKTKANWKVGTKYEVNFKRSLFADHIRLEKLNGDFTSRALKASVEGSEFYIDPKDPRIKKTIAHFYFSHPVRQEDLNSKIQVLMGPESGIGATKNINFSIVMNKYGTDAYIHSESLTIDDRPQTVIVQLEKGLKPKQDGERSDSVLSTKIAVPGRLTAFQILSAQIEIIRNQKYEPEQILLVRTSFEAKSEDVAKNLKIKLLPKDKVPEDSEKLIKDYPWGSASEVKDDLLKQIPEVQYTLIPSAEAYSKVHSFRISTQPEQYIWLQIEKGIKSLGDFELGATYSSVALVKPYPEEVSIMSDGSLLSLSGELKVPLMARNARSVEVNLSRIRPEQINHLLAQISYDIKKPNLSYGFENLTSEKFTSILPLNLESAKATQFFSFDLSSYLFKTQAPKGVFLLKASVLHPNKTYGPNDERLIMVTDLGMIVKETQSKTHEVFVQNIRSGLPVGGALVEVVGRNGLPILNATTDITGHAVFPNLKDFKQEKEPIAFSVRSGNDQAFLPFRNYKQNLQYSRFDVGGLFESSESEQISAMIFSDRGIYRPGEESHLGLIIRSKSNKSKGQKIPLQFTVRDPKGNEVLSEKLLMNPDDLKSAEFKTESTAPTGIYDISLSVIKKNDYLEPIAHETILVEEFQPDHLKIHSSLSKEKLIGWIKVQDLKGFVTLRNLFGTAAEDRLIRGKTTLTPQQPYFKGYDGYQFTHFDQSQLQTQADDLKETRTNTKGEAEFDLNFARYSAPYFSARFDVEGFEADAGRSVKASSFVMLSTLDFMIGAKADGDLDYIRKNTERTVHLVAIDSDLKKMATSDLSVQVIERKYISVLTQSESGAYKYQSVLKEMPGPVGKLKVDAAGLKYKLKTDAPGDYYLVIKNKEDVELLKLPYTVAGEANIARSLDRNSELQLILNKKDFQNGEEIELQIKAPYKGAGLISIERDGVYQYKWFKSETSATVQKIKVPEGLSGNAYVHVTFLRAIDSAEIFMSPLSYAVAPFSISLDDRRTKIELGVPQKVKPGETLKIKYATNHPTNIILYGVDEGILQVAHYKLPNPLGFFFQKRALQVKTYQMLDLIMPEFSLIQQSQAPGGDEGAKGIGKNLNPFRSKHAAPVAFWSDVIPAGPQAKTYSYKVPDYFNGNIKIMAIAADAKKLGSEETSSFVRGDFIINPTVPVFIAPLDEMIVGVSVSNQKEKSGANAVVKLTAKGNAFLDVNKNASQDLQIAEGQEVATTVQVKANNNVGEGEITFEAKHESTSIKAKADVSVRPIVPYQNIVQAGWSDQSTFELSEPTAFYEPYAKKIFSAANSPMALSFGLQNFLESQPYGCTEQVVSRVFPAVILKNIFEKNKKQDDKFKDSIKSLVRILRSRQMPDGGFSLYETVSGSSHPAASLHAITILIELQERHMADVNDMLRKVKAYLTGAQVSPTSQKLVDYRFWAQALYLSARLKMVNGASLTALKQELTKLFKNDWEKDIAGLFVAGTYRLYKQDEPAEQIFKGFRFDRDKKTYSESTHYNYFYGLSEQAVAVYLSALHAGDSYKKIVQNESLGKLTKDLNRNLNTFSAAYLLLAFDAIEKRNASAPIKLQVKAGTKDVLNLLTATQTGLINLWDIPIAADKVQVSSAEDAKNAMFYIFQSSGFASSPSATEVKSGLEIKRQFMVGEKPVTTASAGDEVDVTLAMRTTDNQSHTNIAIVDLLPGGFELIQQRDLNRLDSGNAPGQGDGEGIDEAQPPIDGQPMESEGDGEGASFKFPIQILIPKAYAQVSTAGSNIFADFIDQRDDRIVIYATLTPTVQFYRYKIKAISSGHFNIPPEFAEGMYDRSLRYVGVPAWIDIKSGK